MNKPLIKFIALKLITIISNIFSFKQRINNKRDYDTQNEDPGVQSLLFLKNAIALPYFLISKTIHMKRIWKSIA